MGCVDFADGVRQPIGFRKLLQRICVKVADGSARRRWEWIAFCLRREGAKEKSVPKPSINPCRDWLAVGTLLGFADPTAWVCSPFVGKNRFLSFL